MVADISIKCSSPLPIKLSKVLVSLGNTISIKMVLELLGFFMDKWVKFFYKLQNLKFSSLKEAYIDSD